MDYRTILLRHRDALRRDLYAEMRGRVVMTPRGRRLMARIDEVSRDIDDYDRKAAERLALEKAPVNDVLEVIAIPLLADVMTDIVAGVNATLRRAGAQETVFGTYTEQIRKAALAMVDTLDHGDANLPRLLDADDTLIDAVKKKLMSFIKQRLNIKK